MTDNDDKDNRGGRDRPRGDSRGPRSGGGDRPRTFKPRGDRPDGDRKFGDRPPRRDFGDRPPPRDGERKPYQPRGDKPFRPREDGDRPRAFKPRGDRPEGDRKFGDRPPRRDFGDRPPPRDGERKPFRPRDDGDRPRASKPFRQREDGDRPRSFKPRGDRPDGDRKFGDRKFDDRPPRRDFRDRPSPRRDNREPRVEADADDGNRIAKVIARAGLCSRRDAEAWIEAGRVSVNGVIIESPALDVTDSDTILVDGNPLPARERTRLWLYHKPKGLETTEHSPEGRPTVFDNLPAGLPRVVSVGRLDINTEGLLLLTNDGGLARVLAHPNTGWLRRYRVRVFGPVDQAQLDTLREGITLDHPEDGPVEYAPIVARLERSRGDNSWLTMDLREGKNREIKRVLEHFGLQVTRLIRVSFGPFQLGDMPEGTAEEIRGRYLRDQLGERLMEEAGVDFDAPLFDHAAPQREDGERRERSGFSLERGEGRDRPARNARDRDGRGGRDRFEAEEDGPVRGSPQDREGYSKTAWSAEPLPERRRDSKKPGQKRDAALLGTRDDLKVTKEKVSDRKGREVRVERVRRDVPEDVADAPDYAVRDPNRRFGKQREARGEGRSFGGDRPFRPREDGDRPRSFKPRGEVFKPRGDRPDGDRKPFRPREDGDRPRSFKPRGDGFKPRGDRPDGDRKPFRQREDGDRPRGFGGKPGGFKGGKSGGGKPGGFRPGGGKGGGKPGGARPGGRPRS